MIDRAFLEARLAEVDAERVNAEQTLLRIQGAIVILQDLLALADVPQVEQLPLTELDA